MQCPTGSSLTRIAIPLIALMVCCAAFVARAQSNGASTGERHLELVAMDERTGRAVLIDATGATHILQLHGPETAGIRLRAMAGNTALLDVRDAATDARFAYRIVLGETLKIRAGTEMSSASSTVVVSPAADDGARQSPPANGN